MKILVILLPLFFFIINLAKSKIYFGNGTLSTCVACLGSKYTICETNVTMFLCSDNVTVDCLNGKWPAKYNMYDKCIASGGIIRPNVYSSDT